MEMIAKRNAHEPTYSDSLSLLQSTELRLQTTQEDVNIISKMIELTKLLKNEHSALATMLDNMRTERMQDLRTIQEQLISDPELTTVHLQVTTINGIESLTLHFPNADKRAIWESALIEAKNALMNSLQNDQAPNHLRSILTHRTRPGLTFSVASPTLGKSTEGGAPNVWVCTTDKFSGQVAVVNVNGEPTIESSTGIGNATIITICPVPSPRKRRKMSVKPPVDEPSGNEIPGLELDSSSSGSDDSDSDSSRRNVQSTIWIGNDDGEIFVFNSLDNVRLKSREKMTRLPLPIDDIVYVDEKVFVSLSSSSHIQLLYFRRGKDGNWDMENSKTVRLDLRSRLRPMIAVVSRLCIASANSLYLINPSTTKIEKSAAVSSYPSDSVACMAAHGSTIFVAMNKSTIVKVVNAFTLDCLLEFSISHLINKTLSTQEDIIRQHKMGCLRISALLCCKNRLWIGTSAGIILNTNIASTKTNWTPTFNVCKAGHIGPCRFLTAVSVSSSAVLFDMRRRRMSLNAPSLQQLDQIFVISGGEGYDNNDTEIREEKTGTDDAVNYLLFWTA
uniref:Rho guanine nucleotide exchange factor 17 n=1 Tax=Ascaris lumbricoides TaxID=6252 RepID=A0A0M3IBV9_ASCLU